MMSYDFTQGWNYKKYILNKKRSPSLITTIWISIIKLPPTASHPLLQPPPPSPASPCLQISVHYVGLVIKAYSIKEIVKAVGRKVFQ